MSLTFTPDAYSQPQAFGPFKMYVGELAFDSSYNAGGESIDRSTAQVPEPNIWGVRPISANALGSGLTFRWDYANQKMKIVSAAGGRVQTYAPGGGDLKGCTNVGSTDRTADQASAGTNPNYILDYAAFSSFTDKTVSTFAAQPDVPRSLVIVFKNDTGIASDLATGGGTIVFTVTGTAANGVAQTDTVTFTWSSSSAQYQMANSKFRKWQTAKAFKTISSITWDVDPTATGIKLGIGLGPKIGLPSALETATYTDVTDITINAARVDASSTSTAQGYVDTTNNTISVLTGATSQSDGWDMSVIYKAAAGIEEIAATSLTGISVRAIILAQTQYI